MYKATLPVQAVKLRTVNNKRTLAPISVINHMWVQNLERQGTADNEVYVGSVTFKIQSSEGHPQQSTVGWG